MKTTEILLETVLLNQITIMLFMYEKSEKNWENLKAQLLHTKNIIDELGKREAA